MTTSTTSRPALFAGATVHGLAGLKRLRHRCEIPLVVLAGAILAVGYALWIVAIVQLFAVEPGDRLFDGLPLARLLSFLPLPTGDPTLIVVILGFAPLAIAVVRAVIYAKVRAGGIRMSPTQFPEGYRMVVEAAERFGMRKVPDAYVVLGNGVVNAYASGHGYRRFVVVHSDAFEVGGGARDPEALRFVIGHEVGHLAAGHVSFFRILFISLAYVVPVLGPAVSRAQEYTADNHGYDCAPDGVAGVMGLLSGGKYLGAQVNLHALADRAATERGLWLHVANWMSTHPVHTWRASALRDRSRPGRLMVAPPRDSAWFAPSQPAGGDPSAAWSTPAQALRRLDAAPAAREEQFGRYPGVSYDEPADALRLADPNGANPAAAPSPGAARDV